MDNVIEIPFRFDECLTETENGFITNGCNEDFNQAAQNNLVVHFVDRNIQITYAGLVRTRVWSGDGFLVLNHFSIEFMTL